MKINEVPFWEEFFTELQVPHMEGKEKILSSSIVFKHGQRTLYPASVQMMKAGLDDFCPMILENFADKWERDYKALTSEYDVLYSNRVIYDETRQNETSSTSTENTTSTNKESRTNTNQEDISRNSFDELDAVPTDKQVNQTDETTDTDNAENVQSNTAGNSSTTRGYVKKYSNGLDGANAIEKDIRTRKSKYLDIVLSDIVNYIALSIY